MVICMSVCLSVRLPICLIFENKSFVRKVLRLSL
jgi:hypothetical protein